MFNSACAGKMDPDFNSGILFHLRQYCNLVQVYCLMIERNKFNIYNTLLAFKYYIKSVTAYKTEQIIGVQNGKHICTPQSKGL